MTDMQTKLKLLMEKAQPTMAKIEKLPLESFVAHATFQIWRRFVGRLPHVDFVGLQTRAKVLAYDAGVLGEDLFRTLCKLDDFQGDEIRVMRKQEVLKLKEWMKMTDIIRAKALRWVKLLERLAKRQTPGAENRALARKRAREERVRRAEQEREEKLRVAREEQQRKLREEAVEEERRQQEAERERRLFLSRETSTRWRPTISQKDYLNGVRVFVELPGFHLDEIDINVASRTLTISSDKPGARFREELSISHKFDLDHTDLQFMDGVLVIAFPYSRTYRHTRFSYL